MCLLKIPAGLNVFQHYQNPISGFIECLSQGVEHLHFQNASLSDCVSSFWNYKSIKNISFKCNNCDNASSRKRIWGSIWRNTGLYTVVTKVKSVWIDINIWIEFCQKTDKWIIFWIEFCQKDEKIMNFEKWLICRESNLMIEHISLFSTVHLIIIDSFWLRDSKKHDKFMFNHGVKGVSKCLKLNILLNWITTIDFELNNLLNWIFMKLIWIKYWIESILSEIQTLNWINLGIEQGYGLVP